MNKWSKEKFIFDYFNKLFIGFYYIWIDENNTICILRYNVYLFS